MGTNHAKILLARNKIKIQHKIYLYESMKNIISENGFTISQWMFGCGLMGIEAMNNMQLPYVKNSDRLILNNIRRAIKHI